MIRLEYFLEDYFQQLIDWIPSAEFSMQWGGPSFSYLLIYEQLQNYATNANTSESIKYVFKAVDTINNKTIGHISLVNVDRANGCARIGRVLVGSTDTRGKRYGAQIINAILKFAFEELKLHRVTLGVFDFNHSAIKCYEKAGFKKEDFLHDYRKIGDEYWSLIEMGILKTEWEAKVDSNN